MNYAKGATTLYSLNYYYKTDATHCPAGAANNNGQVQCITDSVDNGRSLTYNYDALGRLSTAVTTGSASYPKWGLSWTYDRYGNRSAQTVTASSGVPANSLTVDANTNHITGSPFAYDADGNMTNDGSNALTYDGENHLLTTSGSLGSGTYSYDGNGLRAKKVAGSTTTVYAFSGSKVIAEYVNGAAQTSPTREYIYSGSTLIAKIESGATQYYHSDHLSVRAMSDSSGNKVGEQGHYPYGESWYASSTTTKWKFTSYERDAESGNDYALARSYVNRLGRFSSPDLLAGRSVNPQSLNRYAYVVGDPINRFDPLGLHDNLVCDSDGNCYDAPPDVTSVTVSASAPPTPVFQSDLDSSFEAGLSSELGAGGDRGGNSGDPIGATLKKLQTQLKLDPNCSSFLSSNGTNAQTELSGIIDNHLYGQTEIPPTPSGPGTPSMTNAVSGGYIPVKRLR